MKKYVNLLILITLTMTFLAVSCKKKNEEPNPTYPLSVNLGPDKTIFIGDSILLNAGNPGSIYLWSTGAVTQTILVNTSGTYWVKVVKGDSTGSDTIRIDSYHKISNVNLGPDKTIFEGDSIILDAGNPGSSYLWSTGVVTQTILVDTTGNYWVKVIKGDSAGIDTVRIDLSYKLSKIETDFGNMLLWLYPQTPLHRHNFIKLTSDHFYDSLIFHRVINNFVIQGGDPLGTGYGGPGYTIPAEFRTYIKHVNGAVGAARLSDDINPTKASNGSQFYIVDNVNGTPNLDGKYTVFGIVIDGIETVDAISLVPTNPANNRPLNNVYMKKVSIVYYTAKELMDNFGFGIP